MSEKTELSLSDRGLQRRTRFLDAATEVFLQCGYESASLQEIVSRAGGSLTTLYRLFGNKEGLFQAVIDRRASWLLEQFDLPQMKGRDPQTVLNKVGNRFLETMLAPEVLSLYRLLVVEAVRNPRLREIFLAVAPERSIRALADYLESEVQIGRLQLPDCATAATLFFSMVKGERHARSLMGEEIRLTEEQREQAVAEVVDLFLNGCRPRG
ncbi:Transcriptional regulator [gamma proteobacterium HdN1]|nr:Transcriptional regulator [gamma proteobacterium HdN1]